MSADSERLRVAAERTFKPPVDLILDPSLLAAERSFERLKESMLFESQRQATLGGTPGRGHVGEIAVPETALDLLRGDEPTDATETSLWQFFRGKARAGSADEVARFLDERDIEPYGSSADATEDDWERTLASEAGGGRIGDVVAETYRFLCSGGAMVARTSATTNLLRDASVTTVDIGEARLTSELQGRLDKIGYPDDLPVCVFAVTGVETTTRALTGAVIKDSPPTVLYRLG